MQHIELGTILATDELQQEFKEIAEEHIDDLMSPECSKAFREFAKRNLKTFEEAIGQEMDADYLGYAFSYAASQLASR